MFFSSSISLLLDSSLSLLNLKGEYGDGSVYESLLLVWSEILNLFRWILIILPICSVLLFCLRMVPILTLYSFSSYFFLIFIFSTSIFYSGSNYAYPLAFSIEDIYKSSKLYSFLSSSFSKIVSINSLCTLTLSSISLYFSSIF